MKFYKFFIYWIATILIGSFLFSICDVIFYSNKLSLEFESLTTIFKGTISASVFSSFYSLFVFIPFLSLNIYAKKRNLTVKKVLIFKTFMIAITFLVMFLLDNKKHWDFYFVGSLCYGLTGLMFWWIEFRRIESKSS